ncbi:hypothetical protein D3C76_1340870 [compost metagenome]
MSLSSASVPGLGVAVPFCKLAVSSSVTLTPVATTPRPVLAVAVNSEAGSLSSAESCSRIVMTFSRACGHRGLTVDLMSATMGKPGVIAYRLILPGGVGVSAYAVYRQRE